MIRLALMPQSSLGQEMETQEREMGDEDPTYFQTRTTVKYDHTWVPGDTSNCEHN